MSKKNRCYQITNEKFYSIDSICYFLVKNYKFFSSSYYNETISLIISHDSRKRIKIEKEKYFLPFISEKKVALYNSKNICFTVGKLGFSIDMLVKNIKRVIEYIKKLDQEKKLFLKRIFLFSTYGPRLELDLKIVTI